MVRVLGRNLLTRVCFLSFGVSVVVVHFWNEDGFCRSSNEDNKSSWELPVGAMHGSWTTSPAGSSSVCAGEEE